MFNYLNLYAMASFLVIRVLITREKDNFKLLRFLGVLIIIFNCLNLYAMTLSISSIMIWTKLKISKNPKTANTIEFDCIQ